MGQLFWYKPIFMTELLLAEALFCIHLKRRNSFVWRLVGALAFCYGVAFAIPVRGYNAVYCSVMFIVMFAVTVFAAKFCFQESWINIVFVTVAGYTMQHIAYEMYDLVVNLLGLNGGNPLDFYSSTSGVYAPFRNPYTELTYFFDYIIVYWSMFMLFGRRIKNGQDLKLERTGTVVLVAVIIIVDVVLSSIITYRSPTEYNSFYAAMLCIFNILCCCLTMYLQFEMSLRKRLETELDVVSRLRREEERQYELAQENIALVNMKCHDMKYQISRICDDNAMDSAAIAEVKNLISIYDSVVKTGNKTLDTILTEKSLLCNSKGIKLTCIADGSKLDFISEVDLYVLFGNILDNAIEAVADLNEDQRVIGLSVKGVHDFLSVNVHNYFDKHLVFAEGLPQTTKADKGYHGFGMKSVQSICHKYGGDMSVKTNGNVFNLSLLFPLAT